MRLVYLCVVCLLALSVTAGAATVNLTMDNLTAQGWKVTATNVYGDTFDASVAQTTEHGVGDFMFYTGEMPDTWEFQWAGISTNAFSGTRLASITSVKIRTLGHDGREDNWQPSTFIWVVDKGDGNHRCVLWKPWSNGNPREPAVWHEHNAAVTGQWFVEETGRYCNSLIDLKAALPNAFFVDTGALPLDWGYASQHAFNVGNCPLYDADRSWFSRVTGHVDWFEIGVSGSVTRYDLGVGEPIPEPGSLVGLAAGLLGLTAFRRRK